VTRNEATITDTLVVISVIIEDKTYLYLGFVGNKDVGYLMINISNNVRAYSLSEIAKKKNIKHGHGMEYCLRFSMQNIKEEAIINICTIL